MLEDRSYLINVISYLMQETRIKRKKEGVMGRTRMLVIIVSFSLLLCFTVSVERKDEKDFKNRFDYYHHFPIYIF